MSTSFPQQGLKAASAAVMVVGLVVAIAAHPASALITNLLADLIYWPFDGAQAVDTATSRLLAAIGGGVMFGWGLLLWQLSSVLLPKDPVLASRMIRTSVIAWFVLDSSCSIAAGAYLNVLLNLGFLAMFLVPLMSINRETAFAAR